MLSIREPDVGSALILIRKHTETRVLKGLILNRLHDTDRQWHAQLHHRYRTRVGVGKKRQQNEQPSDRRSRCFCEVCVQPLASGVMPSSRWWFLSAWFQNDVVNVAGVLFGEQRHEKRSEHRRRPAKKTTTSNVLGDGWFNLCTLISQCTTGVKPHPASVSNHSDSGQVRLFQPAISHKPSHTPLATKTC